MQEFPIWLRYSYFKHLGAVSPASAQLLLSDTEIHVLSQISDENKEFFSYIGATITQHLHQIIIHAKKANTLI